MGKERIVSRPTEAKLNEAGQEILDPVPMAPPVGYVREPSMADRIRDMVRGEHLRLAALSAGQETFEEADDFEVGDDFDPSSPYEDTFDPVEADVRMRLREDDHRRKVEERVAHLRPGSKEKADGDVTARTDKGGKETGDRGDRSADRSEQAGEGKNEASGVRGNLREGNK